MAVILTQALLCLSPARLPLDYRATLTAVPVYNKSQRVNGQATVLNAISKLHCDDCLPTAKMLAFWGSDSREGKFMTLFKLMAKRDLRAAAYLQRIEQMCIKIKLVENQNGRQHGGNGLG